MQERFSRTELLIGEAGLEKLAAAHVAVFGLGGVGGYVVEALARSGVGAFDLIDNDRISVTNINRQIYALESTLGQYKTDAARERILDINPNAIVNTHEIFFGSETSYLLDFKKFDYVIDAIDTVGGKIEIITKSKEAGVPVISSMGAGNKLNPAAFEIADIYSTSVCPLAKVMRRELKKRNISDVKVVFSKEPPQKPICSELTEQFKKQIPASIAFVPSAAGLIIAGGVIKDLIGYSENQIVSA